MRGKIFFEPKDLFASVNVSLDRKIGNPIVRAGCSGAKNQVTDLVYIFSLAVVFQAGLNE